VQDLPYSKAGYGCTVKMETQDVNCYHGNLLLTWWWIHLPWFYIKVAMESNV